MGRLFPGGKTMKRIKESLSITILTVLLALVFSGCKGIGEKNLSMAVIYAALAVISVAIFVLYLIFSKNKNNWLSVLLASIGVVNIGYTMIAYSGSLDFALIGNRVAYFGSVLLPLSMQMMILNTLKINYPKFLPYILSGVAFGVFVIAASPGFSDIYYKEVSLINVCGTTVLSKVYGPLHVVYLIYLLLYFFLVSWAVVYGIAKKKTKRAIEAIMLLAAVFVNIGVWFIEQLVSIEFEMLSVSYIISVLFLIALDSLIKESEKAEIAEAIEREEVLKEKAENFNSEELLKSVSLLTITEHLIFDYYIEGKSTKEIMAMLNIKENTLKFHNKNIYSKLSVSSRKELVEIYKKLG